MPLCTRWLGPGGDRRSWDDALSAAMHTAHAASQRHVAPPVRAALCSKRVSKGDVNVRSGYRAPYDEEAAGRPFAFKIVTPEFRLSGDDNIHSGTVNQLWSPNTARYPC